MFTGIVEGMAEVRSVTKAKRGAETAIEVKLGGRLSKGLKVGDSVCVNGACLTVARLSKKKGSAEFQMVAETVRRTNLGSVRPGDRVNIERSMKMGERLEGHFVLGHVDGTGTIEEITSTPAETKMWIRIDDGDYYGDDGNNNNNNENKQEELIRSLVTKGSIAVDGTSLTLVDVQGDRVSVSLIPHTLKATTLGLRKKGDRVNIEADILGKYVARNLPQKW